MGQIKPLITKDGSFTLYNESVGQCYHSVHGAVSESLHVYIQNGLLYTAEKQETITLLEVGFGTGLNALLTCKVAIEKNIQIHYVTLEPYPVDCSIVQQMNIPGSVNADTLNDIFEKMHYSCFGELINFHPNFVFEKHKTTLEEFSCNPSFNLIYYDAFSPSIQPEMWTEQAFRKISNSMSKDAALVTYCAKGTVKRMLKNLNFKVETLHGANGKREMIRAIKKAASKDAA